MTNNDMTVGLRSVAQRMINAEDAFLDVLCSLGEINRGQAALVVAAFRKAKVIKFDAVAGEIRVKHGAFLDRDVIRRAAEVA